jgi:hypothetical protein
MSDVARQSVHIVYEYGFKYALACGVSQAVKREFPASVRDAI